ncbi:hypothetical protein DM02DRAFT_373134 [Periconia macrospinosa]|uniref:F-box domain-containing protein n=1 Tax=Periconia macrospinosa TaxID=97972 RepID=A0A2V1D0D2_9PLEO|nr:hypothetical protein DM02DRAFT_373134 [Periconia macrospinosa]
MALFLDLKAKGKSPIEKNPLLQQLFPAFLQPTISICYRTIEDILRNMPWCHSEKTTLAIARPETSWRRMYAEQPPRHYFFTSFATLPVRLTMGSIYCTISDMFCSSEEQSSRPLLWVDEADNSIVYTIRNRPCHDPISPVHYRRLRLVCGGAKSHSSLRQG